MSDDTPVLVGWPPPPSPDFTGPCPCGCGALFRAGRALDPLEHADATLDDWRGRLGRIRAVALSDADLGRLPAVRGMLLLETDCVDRQDGEHVVPESPPSSGRGRLTGMSEK